MKFSLFNPWPVYNVNHPDNTWPIPPRFSLGSHAVDGMRKGIELSLLADELGFDYVTVAEHHYHPRQLSPNPFLTAAALAPQLHQAGVAVLGATLPLVNPLRTAEEVCMVDALSGGRLLIGLFRGTPNEFLTYGTNPAESREVFEEAVDLLVQAWTQPEPFAWVGRYYDFRVISVWPRPVQRPHPPILVSANSPESAIHAAKNHFRIGVGFATAVPMAAAVVQYRTAAEAAGWTPTPEHILHRGFCVVAETDEKAEELVTATSYGDMSRLMIKKDNGVMAALGRAMSSSKGGRAAGPPGSKGGPPSTPRPHFMGSPDTVARQIREFGEQTGVGHFDLIFNDEAMPFDQARRGAELFGKEVLPQLADQAAWA